MNADELKGEIDRMSYEQLLRLWRFAPAGDPHFQGDIGEYYSKVMAEKKSAVGGAAAVAASKRIRWTRRRGIKWTRKEHH